MLDFLQSAAELRTENDKLKEEVAALSLALKEAETGGKKSGWFGGGNKKEVAKLKERLR